MKHIIFLFVLLTSGAIAENWKDPESRFDATVKRKSSNITWKLTSNVQETCESESRRRGFGGFGYSVDSCAFWVGDKCTIITNSKSTLHEIGHEMRHCFQGNYH